MTCLNMYIALNIQAGCPDYSVSYFGAAPLTGFIWHLLSFLEKKKKKKKPE